MADNVTGTTDTGTTVKRKRAPQGPRRPMPIYAFVKLDEQWQAVPRDCHA